MRLVLVLLWSAGWAVVPALAQRTRELRSFNEALVNLARTHSPSVVLVVSNAYGPLDESADEVSAVVLRQSTGSGVILSADGLIVTNRHVIQGATRVEVRLPALRRGRSAVRTPGRLVPAKILGADQETDLALLKVEARDLPFLTLGDSDTVRQGQLVFALGSPRGLEDSISMGLISATARQLRPDDRVVYFQTDAAINPGNSGGPLLDIDGQVIGINTLILSQSSGSEGLGFALPSNIVKYVVNEIREHGVVTRGDIGVEAQTITPGLAKALQLPVDQGVILADVTPKGPADNVDLRPGDIILSVDGKPMENARQFHVNVYQHHTGVLIKLEALREGKRFHKSVVVLDRADNPDRFASLVSERINLVPRLGVLALPIEEPLLAQLPPLRRSYGILVARISVAPNGSPGRLLPGDIIVAVNNQPVSTLRELRELVDQTPPAENVVLQLQRDGKLRYVELVLD